MLFPNATTDEWCAKYSDLSPVTERCVVCSRNRTTTIPFIDQNSVGLVAERCQCGQPPESFSTTIFTKGQFDQFCYDLIDTSIFTPDSVTDAKSSELKMKESGLNCRFKILK